MKTKQKTVYKTVCQYNAKDIPEADMKMFQEIARDYCKVKNYIYQRYGGIGSLAKIYPGYTVQNEMTKDGLREKLGMPSVYFYLAVFDALGDIKSQWTRTKSKITGLVGQNEGLTEEEKHFLRFLLKVSNAFEAVLSGKSAVLKPELKRQYDMLEEQVEVKKLQGYLRRQVRKYHVRLHTETAEGFSIAERAYRYADHGIYISVKQKRKRVFVPLTDNNQYKCQLYIKLYPEQNRIEIKVPVQVTTHTHADYTNFVGLAVGMRTMLTTDEGHEYGRKLGDYQTEYADWLRQQTGSYRRNKGDNPGRKKYKNKKKRYEEHLHSYINQELNRFLRVEKPQAIYLPKFPKPQAGGVSRKINNYTALWQRGYIRNRLELKCREQSVEMIEVIGKDISRECSRCGEIGKKEKGMFVCDSCRYETEEKKNAAQNAKKRGQGDGALH
ncbi:MAG: transposase [Dorea sp.]|nr:transposase [Dorea sp.]